MDYLYKLRSAVSTVKSTVESALPGNPISREYETTTAVASAGPSLCWTIYDGYKKSNKQEVSVWWLEKRHIEKWPPRDRDLFMEIVKRGIQQLTRLRHPRLLVIEHALEESKDSLAFCTEPVLASLANILCPPSTYGGGINDDVQSIPAIAESAVAELKKFTLEDIEIKMGFKEVVEALRFLHFDARMIHRNVRPESIIITKRNAWKLAGFEFCLASISAPDQPASFPPVDYDTQCPSFARPQLDFSAPELLLGGRVDVASDIYSLGLVLYAVFNKGKRLFEYRDDMSAFRKNSDNMRTLAPGKLNSTPEIIRDDLKLCLQFTPELRPDAAQLLLIKYFDDPNMKTLGNLENLRLIDGLEKANFFKTLPTTFASFPKRVLTRRVLPALADEMRMHPQTVPLVLPSVLQASELLDQWEFSKFALPALEPVLQLERAYQAWHLILQKVDLVLSKLALEDSKRLLVPMACNALESDSATLHETCTQCLHKLTPMIDAETMRKRIVPKLLTLATEMNVLSVRVNALLCLGRMLDNLEKWQVTEQILPALAKIQSRDPAVLMAVLGVFRLSFNCAKLGGLGRDVCAKVCLPFLVTSCVEQALNARQFEAYMSLIKDMLNKVEVEQRRRLEQAPSTGGSNDDVSGSNNHAGGNGSDMKGSNEKLASLAAAPVKPKTENRGGSLTMEEKRRLANEQEKTIQFRQSTPLEPVTTQANKITSPTSTSSNMSSMLPLAPSSSNTSLSSMLTPQNFSMSPQQPNQQQQPKMNNSSGGGDPFASLNAFAMTQQSSGRTPMLSSPTTNPVRMSTQQQQWPSGISPIRPPPPAPQPMMTGNVSGIRNSMIIPPPPAPPSGSFVKAPSTGAVGINWNQSTVLDGSTNSAFGNCQPPSQSKSKAQDELADLLG